MTFSSFASNRVEIKKKSDIEQIVIDINVKKPNKIFTLAKPERLVIDVPTIRGSHKGFLPKGYNGNLVKKIRFGQFSADTSRFVFDLTSKIEVVSVKAKYGKLFIEVAKKGHSSKPLLPLIMIDAGHGGQDPGATGRKGTREKDVVLRYAKSLRRSLLQTKRYRVNLTRYNDKFIPLRKRIDIARKAKASLFISLHADSASDRSARGLSVYTVSDKASDKEAEALAEKENKSDIIGGIDLSSERKDVTDILISLAQRETKNNSALFADFLVVNLAKKVKMRPNPHRFAGFAVLKAPDIPSVLVEIGFLSNDSEENNINSQYYQKKIVEGIVKGIDAYFTHKKSFQEGRL
ncbi:MAG: N-acetylmuramoyl-L-alanine amidase [Rickettsiales bacterium]